MRGNRSREESRCGRHISIHASTWEATGQLGFVWDIFLISIHASTWEATHNGEQHTDSRIYFNSRLYMRGNRQEPQRERRKHISIHASTWEATQLHLSDLDLALISIHASTWEATKQQEEKEERKNISIHASTWEATAKTYNLFDKIDIIFYQTLFFYSNFSESSLFFNSSSIFLINCIFLPAPMSHKKMYESHQRTHF